MSTLTITGHSTTASSITVNFTINLAPFADLDYYDFTLTNATNPGNGVIYNNISRVDSKITNISGGITGTNKSIIFANDGSFTFEPTSNYNVVIIALVNNQQVSDSYSVTPGGGGGGGGGPVCFLGNAPVLTPTGYRRIDSLSVGDMVRTAEGRDVAIQRVKHQRVPAPSASVNPYVIPKGTWGATENLAISPRHCVAVPDRGMVEARELGLRQLAMKTTFDYYNLELPEWENMVVAGVEVESLAPKKRVVMTAAQFRTLVTSQGIRTEADLAKLARFVEMQADGSVAVTLSRQERRMRA